ncbi:glycosyltransferase [Hahella sp. SMD15-11]|uniref:Glycosyltransferase n=1 Tax=Thermohahella caldifontis TaxID=3142973 RepID=A0AB39UXR1_9GAMM
MLVSIVIPAYNAEKTIARTLDSIKGIVEEDKDVEVIVVDNNSLDSTANIVKNYPFVKLIVSDACYVGG